MIKKISSDINYDSAILAHIFKCRLCGSPLLMFGCNNEKCQNFHKKNILNEAEEMKSGKSRIN